MPRSKICYAFGDSHTGPHHRVMRNLDPNHPHELFPYYLAAMVGQVQLHSFGQAGAMARMDQNYGIYIPGCESQVSHCVVAADWATLGFGINDFIVGALLPKKSELMVNVAPGTRATIAAQLAQQLEVLGRECAIAIESSVNFLLENGVRRILVMELFSIPDCPEFSMLHNDYRALIGAACWNYNMKLRALTRNIAVKTVDVEMIRRNFETRTQRTAYSDPYHFHAEFHQFLAKGMKPLLGDI